MTPSDKIQLAIAIVAGLAAILTAINIWYTNKQVTLQKKQWEHSQTPIFFVNYIENMRSKAVVLILKNTNNVYHHVTEATFSSQDVIVEELSNGYLTGADEQIDGTYIRIIAKDNSFIEGHIQIRGTDILGNEFKAISLPIQLKDKMLENTFKIRKTYFKKL
ncbi:hypothetical protein R0K05_03205 [Planococcus sp. SIMBA_160]